MELKTPYHILEENNWRPGGVAFKKAPEFEYEIRPRREDLKLKDEKGEYLIRAEIQDPEATHFCAWGAIERCYLDNVQTLIETEEDIEDEDHAWEALQTTGLTKEEMAEDLVWHLMKYDPIFREANLLEDESHDEALMSDICCSIEELSGLIVTWNDSHRENEKEKIMKIMKEVYTHDA